MSIANATLLKQIPLFELLDEEEVTVLSEQLDQKTFWAGQMIFQKGDAGGTMYVVVTGKVEIFIKDNNNEKVVLELVKSGELFGELSLLDNEPRSANALALEETIVFVVDHHDLEILFQKHQHAAFDIMAILGRRIRESNVLLTERVVTRNVNEELGGPTNFGERLSDILTRVAGDIRFVYFSFIWFTIWIIWNMGLVPGVEPSDPFPFGLLTMIVSLEAIFLSLFVLISQNRQAAREKVRNDVEYEVNIKAELEIRELHEKVETLQDLLISHLSRVNTNIDTLRTQTGQNPATRPAGST
jgi:uncharacterized membrane protein